MIYIRARSRRTWTTGPTKLFTFQDVPGDPVWCRETWTRTLIYTGLGRNPYRLPVPVKALEQGGLGYGDGWSTAGTS